MIKVEVTLVIVAIYFMATMAFGLAGFLGSVAFKLGILDLGGSLVSRIYS